MLAEFLTFLQLFVPKRRLCDGETLQDAQRLAVARAQARRSEQLFFDPRVRHRIIHGDRAAHSSSSVVSFVPYTREVSR